MDANRANGMTETTKFLFTVLWVFIYNFYETAIDLTRTEDQFDSEQIKNNGLWIIRARDKVRLKHIHRKNVGSLFERNQATW